MINFEQFSSRAAEGNVVVLTRTLMADLLTPVSTYLMLRSQQSPSFLLESVEPNEKIGRYSFIGSGPVMTVRARGQEVTIARNGSTETRAGSILTVLREETERFSQAYDPETGAFAGGFVGYLGYNAVRDIERIPIPAPAADEEDDAVFGLFPTTVRFDHRNQIITLSHAVLIDRNIPLRDQYEQGRKAIEALELKLRGYSLPPTSFQCAVVGSGDQVDHASFCAAVRRAKQYITEGDIFQVVLSRRVTRRFSGDPFAVYRALRMINPSPYLFYLDFGDTQLIGSSPEVLVRSRQGKVEVLPIAGTRKRGVDEAEDRRLETELLNDTKELAEHLMLVDLGRNDIGRLCSYGSVTVPVFKRVERYAHVMHLVSEVAGALRPDVSPVDVLTACFPAGTVSGAPKVRAMEIIAELEPRARGGYAGAVGYIGFDGTLDTCIAIRTIIAHGSTLKIQAGAGIVADSVPESEYEETMNKARSMLEAVRMAASGLSAADMAERWGVRR